MSNSYPSALPAATKLFLDALQAGGKLTSPTGPTVLGQAGAQMGVNPQQGAPAEPEQQGIAAILDQAQQAGPSVANNQAMMQQQQLVDQAANQAAPAAAQMLQQQPQQPQGMAHGGLAAIPSHIQEFKEGGVIGYFEGDLVQDDTEQKKKDIETLQKIAAGSGETLKSLAAAGLDIASLIPRGLLGAAETGITRPLRALGAPIPYLPSFLYGGDASSLTPFTDKLRRKELASAPAPEVRADTAAPTYTVDPETGVAQPIGYATPQELAAEKLNAPRSGVTAKTEKPPSGSSRTSVSTREKMGDPTAPEPSGIAAGTPSVQNFDDSEAQRLYKLRQAQIANKPDFQSMGLADIAAMQKRDEDSASFRRYAAIAGARKPGINAGSSMMAAAGQFAQGQDALANAADAAKTALAKATYAESIGDTDAMLKFQKEFNDNKVKMVEIRQRMDLGIYEQQQANKRNEAVNAIRAQMAAMGSGGGKNLKNPVDVMNIVEDNMEKYMKGWTESREGRMAKGPEREAEYRRRKLDMILEMKAMGAVVPEGIEKLLGGGQTTRTVKLNP